jgi:hypothetical protein
LKNKCLVREIKLQQKKIKKTFASIKNGCIFATAIKRRFGSSVG